MAFMQFLNFRASSAEDAAVFRDEYVRPAMARIRDLDGCDAAGFVLAGSETNPEVRRVIRLQVFGDVAAVIEAEKDRWESYRDDGILEEWDQIEEVSREEALDILGDERLLEYVPVIQELSSQVGEQAYERFDELGYQPDPVDTFPDVASKIGPAGWWSVLHTATVQLGYSAREELDAYTYGIEHALRNIAEHERPEAVTEELDTRIEHLEEMRDRVQEGRLFNG